MLWFLNKTDEKPYKSQQITIANFIIFMYCTLFDKYVPLQPQIKGNILINYKHLKE